METFSVTGSPTNYASFGRRLVAFIIDALVLGVAQTIVIAPLMALVGFGAASNAESLENMSDQQSLGLASGIVGASLVIQIVSLAMGGVYFVLMESSARQATLGKMAMGLRVTDINGGRITPTAAILRYIGRIVSSMILFIGYIMAAFTEKKQALHDLIASTLVLKN